MRLLGKVAVFFGVLSVVSAGVGVHQRSERALMDDATWKVESSGDDHITYIRRRPTEKPKPDCNDTTTTEAPTTRGRARSWGLRSGVEGSRWKSTTPKPNNYHDGYDGDHAWKVSHRSDDHITYIRRGSSGGQGQGQPGELRRLGTGRDSVLARVVIPGKDDHYTEEALVEGAQQRRASTGHSGYPTNDLVHPYVKKTNHSSSTRTKSLKSRKQWKSKKSSSPPNVDLSHEDQPPRVGEVVNGWVVVSKSKDHISWSRWGATSSRSSQNAAAVATLQARNNQNQNRLRSLKTSRRVGGNKKLIPNPQGELVEGFPRIFNTYSRAFFVNERNIDDAGSIRTSLSNSTNWNVGDELAGWRVISKDYRGIVWQRLPTQRPAIGRPVINEEDLLDELNKNQNGDEESDSSSSESESNENDSNYPPGTWYLFKETKNSITWKRDNTPADVVFEMNAYPRVGDTQSGWRVTSKSRGHISWVRVNKDGSEVESNEM